MKNDRVKGVSDERADFEKWAKLCHKYSECKRVGTGYYHAVLDFSWLAWQARSQLSTNTDSAQLHEIFSSIEECPPVLESDSFIVKRVKEMAQLINSLSSDGWVSVKDKPAPFNELIQVALQDEVKTHGNDEVYYNLVEIEPNGLHGFAKDYPKFFKITHWKPFVMINAISQPKGE